MKAFKCFEGGNLSFRLFSVKGIDVGVIEGIAERVCPDMDGLGNNPVGGWVEGKRLMGREIVADSVKFGKYVYAVNVRAERKVPGVLLDIHCSMEEEAEKAARGVEFLPRSVRAEIKKRVFDNLLPDMPVSYSGVPVVIDLGVARMFASVMSDGQVDSFAPEFNMTAGVPAVVVGPLAAAMLLRGCSWNEFSPCCFSFDEGVGVERSAMLGMDFLTWLWFQCDVNGGQGAVDGELFGFMLEGPVSFYREGEGSHETVLRRGSPLRSGEAAVALMCGKKLSKVKFVLVKGADVFAVNVNDEWVFRGLKFPKVEMGEDVFLERMRLLKVFMDCWMALFGRFLDVRMDGDAWNECVERMREWVKRLNERV